MFVLAGEAGVFALLFAAAVLGNGLSFSETPHHVMESHLLKEVGFQTISSLDTTVPYYKNGDDIDRIAAELVARRMVDPDGPAAYEEAESLLCRFLLASEILRQKGQSVSQEEMAAKLDLLPAVEPTSTDMAVAFDPGALTPPYAMAWPSLATAMAAIEKAEALFAARP